MLVSVVARALVLFDTVWSGTLAPCGLWRFKQLILPSRVADAENEHHDHHPPHPHSFHHRHHHSHSQSSFHHHHHHSHSHSSLEDASTKHVHHRHHRKFNVGEGSDHQGGDRCANACTRASARMHARQALAYKPPCYVHTAACQAFARAGKADRSHISNFIIPCDPPRTMSFPGQE